MPFRTLQVLVVSRVAFAMARFAATLHDVPTTRDLQEALAYLQRTNKEQG